MLPVWLIVAGCTTGRDSASAWDSRPGSDFVDSGTAAPFGPPVVIGAGLAGLAAAADLPGAIVLEASDAPGGRAANWGQRRFFFHGTDVQVALGAEESVEEVMADWPSMTGGEATDDTRTFLAESASVHDRMEALGLRFLDPPGPDLITGRDELFTVEAEGDELAAAFVASAAAGVELRLSTPATSLLVDDSGLIGVETADGVIETNRVLLATGGYTGRIDIVERYASWPAGTWEAPHEENSGFAWDLAQSLGLGLSHLDAMGAFDGYLGDYAGGGILPLGTAAPLLWVDRTGQRFVDESELGSIELETAFWAHDPTTVVTTDADVLSFAYLGTDDEYLSVLRCYPSFAALAAAEGVDPVGLQATVEAVKAFHAATATDPLGRAGYDFPALAGTPCAATEARKTAKSYGGVTVDDEGRALMADGSVLPGLWVAGEAAGMGAPGMGGLRGFDGSLSAVVWSGWRAAASMNAAGIGP